MAILTPVVLYPGTAGNPDVHDILKPTDSIKALPTGAAGGILSGTYPNPSINLTNCSGTAIAAGTAMATCADLGTAIAAIPPNPTTLPPSGAAGGILSGTYPNPSINLTNCSGTAITAGTAMATCAEMGTAISTAIAAIPAADGSETKLVAGTNTSVTGTGTTANPFVVNALPDATKADLVGGVVPASQLPSFVDDVLEFPTLAGFPATGEAGKIYIDAATSKTYRWSGTTYVSLSSDYALTVLDEGSVLTTAATSLNFVGSGINATSSGGAVTVTIPSGSPTRTTSSVPPTVAPVGNVVGSVYVDTVLDEEWVWDGARWNLLRGYKTVLGGTLSGSLGDTDNYLSLVTWTPPRANMALSVSGDIYFTWSGGVTLQHDFRVHLTLRKNGLIIAGQTVMISSGHGTHADYWANVSIAYMQLGDPNSTNEDISLGVELLETVPVEPRIDIRAHTVYIHAVD